MARTFAERFNLARLRKGLSLQDVADKTGHISKQALHKYEQGKAYPENEVFMRLCAVLDVDPDYFLRPVTVGLQDVDFRKRVKLTKTEESRILVESTDHFERYVELEQLMGEEIRFQSPVGVVEVNSQLDVEAVARRIREALQIGTDPIPNVIGLLEDMGVKCFKMLTSEAFDGLTATINPDSTRGKHIGIVVNTYFDVVRQRFTASHELAHQVLRFAPNTSKNDIEAMCHDFAGSLLLPRERMIQILSAKRKKVSIYELADIKARFGVSMQAVLRRAKDLEIISNTTYTGLSIYFTKQGWRQNEPGAYKGEERAVCFNRLLNKAVSEQVISLDKAVILSGQSLAAFRESMMLM